MVLFLEAGDLCDWHMTSPDHCQVGNLEVELSFLRESRHPRLKHPPARQSALLASNDDGRRLERHFTGRLSSGLSYLSFKRLELHVHAHVRDPCSIQFESCACGVFSLYTGALSILCVAKLILDSLKSASQEGWDQSDFIKSTICTYTHASLLSRFRRKRVAPKELQHRNTPLRSDVASR